MPAVWEMYVFLYKNGIDCVAGCVVRGHSKEPHRKIKKNCFSTWGEARGDSSLREVACPILNLTLLVNRQSVCVVNVATRIKSK